MQKYGYAIGSDLPTSANAERNTDMRKKVKKKKKK